MRELIQQQAAVEQLLVEGGLDINLNQANPTTTTRPPCPFPLSESKELTGALFSVTLR